MYVKIGFGNYFRVSVRVTPAGRCGGSGWLANTPPTRRKRESHRKATRLLSSFQRQRFAVAVSRQVKTDDRAPHGSTSTCWKQAPVPEHRADGGRYCPHMLGGVGLKVPLERCSFGIFGNCVSLQDLASAENRTASVPENSRSRACPQRSQ